MKEIPSFPVDKTIIIPWNIGLRSLREDHVKIPGGSSGRRRNSANSATRSFVFWAEKGPTRTFISGKRLPLPTSALNGSRDASAETGSPPVRTALQISLAIKRHPSPLYPLPRNPKKTAPHGSLATEQNSARIMVDLLSLVFWISIYSELRPLITITLPPSTNIWRLFGDRKKVSSSLWNFNSTIESNGFH